MVLFASGCLQPRCGRASFGQVMSRALRSSRGLLCNCCLSFQYKIEYSQLGSRQLHVSVWHAGALKYRVFLGEVVIPLAEWNFKENSQFNWYQLKPKVILSFCAYLYLKS